MKKIKISEEELEQMNYNDIAHIILTEKGKKMKINDLFKEVGELLNLNSEEYQSYIGDFFELLSTDKRFIMLEDGYWDLKIKHNKGMETFEDEDEEEDVIIIDEDNMDNEEAYDDDNTKSSDDDVSDDDLSDLVIVDDIEDEANI